MRLFCWNYHRALFDEGEIRMTLLAGSAVAGTGLAGALKTALVPSVCLDNAAVIAPSDALATAIITYIKANAVVTPTLLLAPPGTAGGPVTGTGTIT